MKLQAVQSRSQTNVEVSCLETSLTFSYLVSGGMSLGGNSNHPIVAWRGSIKLTDKHKESFMPATTIKTADRLAMRSRPPGSPVMHQTWEKLLFMHWPIAARAIRPLIPEPLEIETFEGLALIAITPFRLTHLRPVPGPEIPGLNSFYELNMRTYVQREGIPGIWFFSLDASNRVKASRDFPEAPYA